MGTKAQMLELLKSQVGHVGGEKYWREMFGWSGNGLPFCAVGVSWALMKNNTKCPYFPSKVAFDRRDKSVIGSCWVDRYDLQPLDAVAFDWDGDGSGDHVGFVIERKGAGVYRTIEFNVSNEVDYRTRYASQIVGGIRPYYDEEKPSKLAVDGVFGYHTAYALQTRLAAAGCYMREVDGDWGYYSRLALQQYLRGKGYYTTAYLLDGVFGYYSVVALEKYLKKLGYYTKEYMAKLGYKNIACLNDGDWGFYTTVALQCALNDGKF